MKLVLSSRLKWFFVGFVLDFIFQLLNVLLKKQSFILRYHQFFLLLKTFCFTLNVYRKSHNNSLIHDLCLVENGHKHQLISNSFITILHYRMVLLQLKH